MSVPTSVCAPTRARERGRSFIPAVVLTAAAALVIMVLITGETGIRAGSRVARLETTAVSRPEAPLWGIANWPLVIQSGFVVAAVLGGVVGATLSWRRGAIHPLLTLYFAFATTSWIDPIFNWATYAVFDPRLLHPPVSWPFFSLAPNVEPWTNLVGYSAYYIVPAVTALWLFRRLRDRNARLEAWVHRYPKVVLGGMTFVLAIPYDFTTELLMIRAQMYRFAQYAGPSINLGKVALPLLVSLTTATLCAVIAVFLHRDDRGEVPGAHVTARFPFLAARPQLASFVRQVVAFNTAMVVVVGGVGLVRVGGLMKSTTEWIYTEQKVYDPDGIRARRGEPGPFYEGIWSGR